MAILDTYNNQTLLTFLDIVFKAVSTEDGEIPKVTYPRICAGHMMHLISKWASKLSKKDASSASSVHLAKRLFGRLIQSESLEDMTRIVIDATIVFCSTKITDEVKAALERLTQAVNTFKPANLLSSITEGHENYPCEDENDNENCDENCNGSELPKELSNQLKNCLFMKHWNSIVSKAKDELSSSKSAKDLLDNKYFFPSFLDHIHSNYLQFCPLWSKIAFSRATDDFETKRFDKLGCRTIKSSADTNAQVEEFFWIKKRTTFRNVPRADLMLAAPPSDRPVSSSKVQIASIKLYSGVSKLIDNIITTMLVSHLQNVVLSRVPILTKLTFFILSGN